MQKINLCETCSKEKGIDDPAGFALAEMLLGLGITPEIKKEILEITCPICHFTQTDFKKTGRLGCSTCYDIFLEGLLPMLRTMHSGMVHRGKVPAKLSVERAKKLQVKALQQSLEKAITEEHYEVAARLRDEIQELQKPQEEKIPPSSENENDGKIILKKAAKSKKNSLTKTKTSLTTRSYHQGEKKTSSKETNNPLSSVPPSDQQL